MVNPSPQENESGLIQSNIAISVIVPTIHVSVNSPYQSPVPPIVVPDCIFVAHCGPVVYPIVATEQLTIEQQPMPVDRHLLDGNPAPLPQRAANQHPSDGNRASNNEPTASVEVGDVASGTETVPRMKKRCKNKKKAASIDAKSVPIVKKTYVESPEVAGMSASEIEHIRNDELNIAVSVITTKDESKPDSIANPIKTFKQAFRNYPIIATKLKEQKLENPTPMQAQCWPIIMSGEDLIGIAPAKSGKTLAFLLPAIIHVGRQALPRDKRVGPVVLILTPTREKVLQIEQEINKYSFGGLKSVSIYGGNGNAAEQLKLIKGGKMDIVVATPGRFCDFYKQGKISADYLTFVVLDEVDKMLDINLESQLDFILSQIREDRQMVLTGTSWPLMIKKFAAKWTVDPVQVVDGCLDLTKVNSIQQRIVVMAKNNKASSLTEFAARMFVNHRAIVVCNKSVDVYDLTSDWGEYAPDVVNLVNGEKKIQEINLEEIFGAMVLFTTDLATPGLSFDDITHLIFYDFPESIEEYVEGLRLVGKVASNIIAFSLFTQENWTTSSILVQLLEYANQDVPVALRAMSDRYESFKKRNQLRGGFEHKKVRTNFGEKSGKGEDERHGKSIDEGSTKNLNVGIGENSDGAAGAVKHDDNSLVEVKDTSSEDGEDLGKGNGNLLYKGVDTALGRGPDKEGLSFEMASRVPTEVTENNGIEGVDIALGRGPGKESFGLKTGGRVPTDASKSDGIEEIDTALGRGPDELGLKTAGRVPTDTKEKNDGIEGVDTALGRGPDELGLKTAGRVPTDTKEKNDGIEGVDTALGSGPDDEGLGLETGGRVPTGATKKKHGIECEYNNAQDIMQGP